MGNSEGEFVVGHCSDIQIAFPVSRNLLIVSYKLSVTVSKYVLKDAKEIISPGF